MLTAERTEIIGDRALAIISKLHTVGFADLTVSGRYALLDASFVVSLQGGVKLPLGYQEQPDNDGAPLGTGDVDFEGHLLVGKSLFPIPAYLTGSIGYRCRTGELHDQVLGYSAGDFHLTELPGSQNPHKPAGHRG